MQTTASTRATTASSRSHTPTNGGDTDIFDCGEKKGFFHLLENLTLGETLAAIDRERYASPMIYSFLRDGVLPSTRSELDFLANFMLKLRQADVLSALAKLAPVEIDMAGETEACALLALAHSGRSFSNLTDND